MSISKDQAAFTEIENEYDDIYVIISPPRCSSTAFARVFWEQPTIRYYCHEPFEGMYFTGQGLDDVIENVQNPLDVRDIKSFSRGEHGRSLVVKEMPYQVGEFFPSLISLSSNPVIFLTRDPRQNIASRMAKKMEVGDDPLFSQVETGWELIANQIRYCKEEGIQYMIVDAKDFRNQPEMIFNQVFSKMGLPFHRRMLSWQSSPDVDIDNLDGDHHHLYQEVLSSTGMLPDTAAIPSLDSFPTEKGLRAHVASCLQIYEQLQRSSARIRVPSGRSHHVSQEGICPGG